MKNKTYSKDVDMQDVALDDEGQRPDGEEASQDAGNANVSDNNGTESDKPSDVAGCERAAKEWQDKYLRLSAEFDNYRKRTLKEKMEIAAAGGEEVIKAMLPVLDDMDRAMDAMQKTEDIASVRSGIELISQKLRDMLKAKGLKEIEALGQQLDTDFHEAVAKFPAEPENKGKVIDVAQKGYQLKDKVIRHSKVVVGE